MKHLKRISALLTALVFLVTLFTGCSSPDSNQGSSTTTKNETHDSKGNNESSTDGLMVTPAGEFPIAKEKVQLTVFLSQSAIVSGLEDNEATRALEEKLGIDLVIEAVPQAAAQEKKQLMLASESYPDIFLAGDFNNEEILTYGSEQSIFIPLNDLIEKYAPNIKKAYMETNYRKNIIAPDGNIYGLTNINECYHCMHAQKYWINQRWLDNLGLDTPTTTEEFTEVLRAFKEQDANGNGDPNDEIPLTASPVNGWYANLAPFLMNAFIYDDHKTHFAINDGKLSFSPLDDRWKDGLTYVKGLYDEGLIDKAAFTQSKEQIKQIGNRPGDNIIGCVAVGHIGDVTNISDDNPRYLEYVALSPLKGPDGHQTTANFKGPKAFNFIITDKCKYPEVAMRLADYLASEEGTLLTGYGPESIGYRLAESDEKGLFGEPAKYAEIITHNNKGEQHNASWTNLHFTNKSADFRASFAANQDIDTQDGYEKRLTVMTKDYYADYSPEEWFTSVFLEEAVLEEAVMLKLNIMDYVNQATVKFIVGQMDIETEWNKYLKELDKLKVDRFVEIYSTAYSAGK